jgi:hypothetical protein
MNNDNGVDEVAWIKTSARTNFPKQDPAIDCFNPSAPKFGPGTSLTTGALTPPADGFFEPSAYLGAFKDASDTWATTGTWVVWSDK